MLSTTERFYTIAGEVLSADLPLDPWIQRYYASTKRRDGAEQYVRFQTDLLDLAGIKTQGLKVIDAGCGFGFTMVVHALLGAEVTGIELSPLMAQTVETYLPILPEDVRDRINVIRGDVAAMALPDQSADVVLSLEAISHYLDVGQFVQEAARVLRPGGVLIIADGNNGSNPIVRRKTYDIWEAAERGPGGEVHGHILGKPYCQVRYDILHERYPELSATNLRRLADATAGFTSEAAVEAADTFLRTGELPDSVYQRGQLAIDPRGAAMERLFFPARLARTLTKQGFRAKAYSYFGGASGRRVLRTANGILSRLSPLTLPVAPSFRVIARRV